MFAWWRASASLASRASSALRRLSSASFFCFSCSAFCCSSFFCSASCFSRCSFSRSAFSRSAFFWASWRSFFSCSRRSRRSLSFFSCSSSCSRFFFSSSSRFFCFCRAMSASRVSGSAWRGAGGGGGGGAGAGCGSGVGSGAGGGGGRFGARRGLLRHGGPELGLHGGLVAAALPVHAPGQRDHQHGMGQHRQGDGAHAARRARRGELVAVMNGCLHARGRSLGFSRRS